MGTYHFDNCACDNAICGKAFWLYAFLNSINPLRPYRRLEVYFYAKNPKKFFSYNPSRTISFIKFKRFISCEVITCIDVCSDRQTYCATPEEIGWTCILILRVTDTTSAKFIDFKI